jgi:hypothetical protein
MNIWFSECHDLAEILLKLSLNTNQSIWFSEVFISYKKNKAECKVTYLISYCLHYYIITDYNTKVESSMINWATKNVPRLYLSVLLSELVPNIMDDISQCITYNTTGIQSIYNIELKIKLGIIYTVCLS